jgi:hypothetical protein
MQTCGRAQSEEVTVHDPASVPSASPGSAAAMQNNPASDASLYGIMLPLPLHPNRDIG